MRGTWRASRPRLLVRLRRRASEECQFFIKFGELLGAEAHATLSPRAEFDRWSKQTAENPLVDGAGGDAALGVGDGGVR